MDSTSKFILELLGKDFEPWRRILFSAAAVYPESLCLPKHP
jgi:hypothetical protein